MQSQFMRMLYKRFLKRILEHNSLKDKAYISLSALIMNNNAKNRFITIVEEL